MRSIIEFKRRARLRLRILKNVKIHPETGCWIWRGSLNNKGYPTLTMRMPGYTYPVKLFAHRVALEVFTMPPAPGLEAAHAITCPFRNCVRPHHLRWATPRENSADVRHPERIKIRELWPPVHVISRL